MMLMLLVVFCIEIKEKDMKWSNGEKMTGKEEKIVKALWLAGCKCVLPLIGYKEGCGYRCRICNVVSIEIKES